jgi:hypothetical protein
MEGQGTSYFIFGVPTQVVGPHAQDRPNKVCLVRNATSEPGPFKSSESPTILHTTSIIRIERHPVTLCHFLITLPYSRQDIRQRLIFA